MTEAAVTDTHPSLPHAAGSRRLGRRAAEVFDAAERQAATISVDLALLTRDRDIGQSGLVAVIW